MDDDVLTTRELAYRIGTSVSQIGVWHRAGLIEEAGKHGRSFTWFWSTTRRNLIDAGRLDPQSDQRKYRKQQWQPLPETVAWARANGFIEGARR